MFHMNQQFQYDTELKLGENRGKPRVWIEGKKLAEAGFLPGNKFVARFRDDSIELLAVQPGMEDGQDERTVSGKERESGPHPIIDMNTAKLREVLPGAQRIKVKMSFGRILITAAKAIVAAAALLLGNFVEAKPLLISLCDHSGEWSKPYLDRYRVIRVDLGHPPGRTESPDGAIHIGIDVRQYSPDEVPDAVLAAPPCTVFCRPSVRWWPRQDATGQTARDIEIFRACLRICQMAKKWWALENPPGRHQRLIPELGKPAWQFQPFHYGDPWWKQTYIWGTAQRPPPTKIVQPPATIRTPNGKTQGVIARMSSAWKRMREMTPPGFAAAFAQYNS